MIIGGGMWTVLPLVQLGEWRQKQLWLLRHNMRYIHCVGYNSAYSTGKELGILLRY